MSWQLAVFVAFVVLSIIFMLYWTLMEYIAEAKHKEFTFKSLLTGPEGLVKHINNLEEKKDDNIN
jgi:hypothetical protein